MRFVALYLGIVLAASAAQASPEIEGAAPLVPEGPRVTVAFTGDILFGRYLRGRTDVFRRVAKTDEPFADVAPVLRGVDIAFGNIESPVMVEPAQFTVFRSLTFRAEPSDAGVMAAAGYDVVSVANNHTLNLGPAGAAETPGHVRAAGMVPVGAGADLDEATRPGIVEVNGVRVAFVCYSVWTNGRAAIAGTGAMAKLDRKRIRDELAEVVRSTRTAHAPDFVVVSLHWGIEGEPHPDDGQRRAARAAIDAGADVVVGHHPHVVQDIEIYRGKPIAYSLGNFLFDNPRLEQRRTVILEATLVGTGDDRRVVGVTAHPIVIERDRKARSSVPVRARGRAYRAWARELRKLAPDVIIAPEPD